MPTFVIDCSIAIAWCFPDEQGDYPAAVLDRLDSDDGLVPTHWPLEVANALLVGERRGRASSEETAQSCVHLAGLAITIDPETAKNATGRTLDLARFHGLSIYDAAYLELAERLSLPLATLDKRLRAAATAAGVALFAANPP